MADDSLYQKKVARRMLQMTQHINESWKDNHVGGTGVTCFTCHRGQPVPAHVWFTDPARTAPAVSSPATTGRIWPRPRWASPRCPTTR